MASVQTPLLVSITAVGLAHPEALVSSSSVEARVCVRGHARVNQGVCVCECGVGVEEVRSFEACGWVSFCK
jgi:hypothetical protein